VVTVNQVELTLVFEHLAKTLRLWVTTLIWLAHAQDPGGAIMFPLLNMI
jgi:hypothetical protein